MYSETFLFVSTGGSKYMHLEYGFNAQFITHIATVMSHGALQIHALIMFLISPCHTHFNRIYI